MSKVHQEVVFDVPPARVYHALMDGREHAAFTGGGPANIAQEEGGTFTAHGGRIEGRNIELVPNRRVVQAWRGADWPEGVYSVVRFELVEEGDGTRLILDHDALPAGKEEMIGGSWQTLYWEPLRSYFA